MREKSPRGLFRVGGLLDRMRPLSVERLDDQLPGFFAMRDLSGLHHDAASGSLLLLSDDSGVWLCGFWFDAQRVRRGARRAQSSSCLPAG